MSAIKNIWAKPEQLIKYATWHIYTTGRSKKLIVIHHVLFPRRYLDKFVEIIQTFDGQTIIGRLWKPRDYLMNNKICLQFIKMTSFFNKK